MWEIGNLKSFLFDDKLFQFVSICMMISFVSTENPESINWVKNYLLISFYNFYLNIFFFFILNIVVNIQ